VKVAFKGSFARDLKKIKDKVLLRQVKVVIEQVERAVGLHEVNNQKQLKGDGRYYRIRIGDYRIGLVVENDTVIFVRFLHRREIYRYFP
jgi:addiction module toxin, RelE/StbE family